MAGYGRSRPPARAPPSCSRSATLETGGPMTTTTPWKASPPQPGLQNPIRPEPGPDSPAARGMDGATILYIEDNDDHAELINRELERMRPRIRLVRLTDGEQALE